jgi:hypothetical protein
VRVLDLYQTYLVDSGRSAALWLLLGFLVTYAVTRWTTVRIKARNDKGEAADGAVKDVFIGGVHIHHQVWGILLVMLTGLLEFRFQPASPWAEVLATLFGVGAALALDEFALWLHVEDVYWSSEGRKSIDAVMVAVVIVLVLVVGTAPFGVSSATADTGWYVVLATLAVHLVYTVICLLKGKLITGLLGFLVPLVGLVGAIRLAKPQTYWARRYYGPQKQARAEERFGAAYQARRERLRDMVSGGNSGAGT